MSMYTDQTAFNKAANHLLKQGEKSFMNDDDDELSPSCAYRGAEAKMCAIGCLIPDDEYKEGFERRSVDYLKDTARLPCLQGLNGNMLRSLQTVHDACNTHEWRGKLRKIAKLYKVSTRWLK